MEEFVAKIDAKFLVRDIDRGSDIFVDGFDGHAEGFAEEIEAAIAADEADEMVAAGLRFRQGK